MAFWETIAAVVGAVVAVARAVKEFFFKPSPAAPSPIVKPAEAKRLPGNSFPSGGPMDLQLLVAGVSAALQAAEVWLTFRDRKRAASTFNVVLKGQRDAAETRDQATALVQLVPDDVLQTFERRVGDCWRKYQDVLQGADEYLPDELDEATRAVRACLCRELRRLYDLNGSIPAGTLTKWWKAYCV